MQEQWVVGLTGKLGHGQRRGVGQSVAVPDDELIEVVAGVQGAGVEAEGLGLGRAGRGLGGFACTDDLPGRLRCSGRRRRGRRPRGRGRSAWRARAGSLGARRAGACRRGSPRARAARARSRTWIRLPLGGAPRGARARQRWAQHARTATSNPLRDEGETMGEGGRKRRAQGWRIYQRRPARIGAWVGLDAKRGKKRGGVNFPLLTGFSGPATPAPGVIWRWPNRRCVYWLRSRSPGREP